MCFFRIQNQRFYYLIKQRGMRCVGSGLVTLSPLEHSYSIGKCSAWVLAAWLPIQHPSNETLEAARNSSGGLGCLPSHRSPGWNSGLLTWAGPVPAAMGVLGVNPQRNISMCVCAFQINKYK